jgi:hypothetical protein
MKTILCSISHEKGGEHISPSTDASSLIALEKIVGISEKCIYIML